MAGEYALSEVGLEEVREGGGEVGAGRGFWRG